MNGKDLEKALLWEAPHIGEKAPEQIPEAQNFCEGYKTFLNEGKTERECVKKAVSLLTNAVHAQSLVQILCSDGGSDDRFLSVYPVDLVAWT